MGRADWWVVTEFKRGTPLRQGPSLEPLSRRRFEIESEYLPDDVEAVYLERGDRTREKPEIVDVSLPRCARCKGLGYREAECMDAGYRRERILKKDRK